MRSSCGRGRSGCAGHFLNICRSYAKEGYEEVGIGLWDDKGSWVGRAGTGSSI